MNKLFKDFNPVSKEDWKEKILIELKGKDHTILEFNDPIEGISFDAYYHQSDLIHHNDLPGNFPYQRGFNRPLNDWNNTAAVIIDNEKHANQHALKLLMSGADSLWFISEKEDTDWRKVLEEIQLEHIATQFTVKNLDEYRNLIALTHNNPVQSLAFNFDAFAAEEQGTLQELSKILKSKQLPSILIDGFKIQQCGASASQEIAFCLSTGNEVLHRLIDYGLSVDEAAACIHFHVGVGSDYFMEIAKIKELKKLWAKIIKEYKPEHACSHKINITAVIGHTNKSLIDPHTNLLRQTTETMSALNAGIDSICVLPYDLYAANGISDLPSRMAINIPLILKEESYLDKVIDPVAGSYSIDRIQDALGRKSWRLFQSLESKGGIFNTLALKEFTQSVKESKEQRIALFSSKKAVGIGINKYVLPSANDNSNWIIPESYLGLNALILEIEFKAVQHEN